MAKEKPRKRVTDLKVHEISFVDNPAVPKAKFLIVKRHDVEGGGKMELEKESLTPEAITEGEVREAAEKISKQQFETMKEARGMIGKLMLKRNDLPGFFRRMVMELDIALDEFMREREAILGKADPADAEGETTEEDTTKREGEEKPEEEKEEKVGEEKPEEEEEEEEKAGHKDDKKGEKKQEEKKCPPNFKFDEAKGKCVPDFKSKDKSEKKEDEESAPRGDGEEATKSLELSPAQQKRVDKLLAKYKK